MIHSPIDATKSAQDLSGIWNDAFSDDFDIDKELYEIRHAWEAEWPELSDHLHPPASPTPSQENS